MEHHTHENHVDYVHNGYEDHWDQCTLEVNEKNPGICNHVEAVCQHHPDCGHEQVPHGNHTDYLVNGRLQHVHDDHGAVEVL
ncbi:hypothetical protein IGI96_003621 [Enterococcus sp. DIV0421]|uniref:hypothetical protein n=1 Tax=Enterococcus sp. DIV0421 TaxID=2774688 RepID=UPI003F24066C